MVHFIKDSVNRVTFTLREKSRLNDPFYIFVLTDDDRKIVKTFSATNISTFTRRHDTFDITESTNEDLLNGVVNLDTGFGDYIIYESPFQSLTGTASGVVEVGRYNVTEN